MEIIRKQTLGFQKKYVYIIALVISVIILIQVSTTNGRQFQVFLGHIILFISNYMVWAFLIEYINGLTQIQHFKVDKVKGTFVFIISILALVAINLIITNVLYYSYIILTSDISVNEALNRFKPFIVKSALSRLLDIGVIIVLLRIVQTYRTLQDKKLQVVSLKNDLHQTQLLALQSQLNPHFLFNALHTLNTLIGYDNAKAQSMVIKITHLLRKILSHKETPLITFQEELEYFEIYLDIEQERFNDRLNVILDVDDAALDIKVPTLLLQPLVENAFKHGISQIEDEAEIKLVARLQNNDMLISIKNTIPKSTNITQENSTKIGLNNLQQRLETMFSVDYEFSTTKENNEFVATILIKDVN
ncbi:histidine kinase [uncultured Psychroserpens sp.]|uniref:sensor histidine kinase n=1 Tax=uncultured Psychroserpens sp. TaxID=255436 RepID=UPI00260A1336|nr:histidine kinase [uncultured Psychroserpens sp.]